MNDHVDLDLIAAFREGLLDPATAERTGRHLDGCAACAQREAALDEVTTHLAEAPTPPMPPALASRLDAALAAEIAAAATQPAAVTEQTAVSEPAMGAKTTPAARVDGAAVSEAGAGRAAPGPPSAPTAQEAPPARRQSRHPGGVRRSRHTGPGGPAGPGRRGGRRAVVIRTLAAAATVFLLAGGGYLLLRPHTPGTSSSALRPAVKSVPSGSESSRQAPIAGPRNSGIGAAALVVSSGTRYQPATLRADANKVLQRYETRIPSPSHVANSPAQPFGTSRMSGCLLRVSNGRRPLIADIATYEGRPATVIIAPANSTVRGHVWVVGPACSATDSDIIAQSGL